MQEALNNISKYEDEDDLTNSEDVWTYDVRENVRKYTYVGFLGRWMMRINLVMPLNYYKDVKKDSRCGSNLSALTTVMEQDHQCHEQNKITMSALAQKCVEEDLKARQFMLAYKYIDDIY